MIYKKLDSAQYRREFRDKFTSFGEKAPIMLSFVTDEVGVTIVHENSSNSYFYAWDYTIPVKAFIHNIKNELSRLHYPRLTQTIEVQVPYTAEEQADMLTNGTSVEAIPAYHTEIKKITYRIDKVLAMKDEFILINEETQEQLRYKMNSSSIYFLKSYRQGDFKSIEEAGNEFFKKSTLVGTLMEMKK